MAEIKVLTPKSHNRNDLQISALTEPNRQKSCRKKGFRARKSQPEIANRQRLSIAPSNRNAALLSLVSEIAAISGVRYRHRNRKSQKSLRFRCAKFFSFKHPEGPEIEKIQDFPSGLKISIEIENFNRD